MLRCSTFLLACFMALSTVMAKNTFSGRKMAAVDGRQLQCTARGLFEGACVSQNIMARGFRCDELWCAKLISPGIYEAVSTGPVLDGTGCTTNKVCIGGECKVPESGRVAPRRGDGPQYTCRSSVIVTPSTNNPNQQRNSVIVRPSTTKKRTFQ
ncbi:uncharacterized protein [Venturia canescens]|uniref:uncharacterized protein n=1 Tax=Venturia canescens TaxID=32260 RepID=UPI001C9D5823|nr:uncharacterized protein LOC122411149 [Venturia canescens]